MSSMQQSLTVAAASGAMSYLALEAIEGYVDKTGVPLDSKVKRATAIAACVFVADQAVKRFG